jgi:antitoxin HicB
MTVEEYLRQPYTKTLRLDDEGDVVARVVEFPGCVAHGADEAEALESLAEVQRGWIKVRLELGLDVPNPEEQGALPSGKWLQRVPRSLHKKLADLAARENVSLNQLVTSILAEAVGTRVATGARKASCNWEDIMRLWSVHSSWSGRAELKAKSSAGFLRLASELLPTDVLVTESEYAEETTRHGFVRRIPAHR